MSYAGRSVHSKETAEPKARNEESLYGAPWGYGDRKTRLSPLLTVALAFLFTATYSSVIVGAAGRPDLNTTVLAASCIGLAFFGLVHLVLSRFQSHVPAYLAIILASSMAGYFAAPAYSYASSKRVSWLMTSLLIVGGYWLLKRWRHRRLWIILTIVLGLAVLATAAIGVNGRLGNNTIATGRALGAALVVLVLLILTAPRRKIAHSLVYGALAAGLATALLATGSRGPVLTAALVVLMLGAKLASKGRAMRAALALGAIFLGYQLLQTADDQGASRVASTLSGEIDGTETRRPRWLDALHAIADHPLGVGWGNFRNVTDVGTGERQYPHNLLLEIYVEAGWVTGTVFLIALITCLVVLWKWSHDRIDLALLSLALFLFMNAMVSGDINDNRPMWVLFGMCLAINAANRAASPQKLRRQSGHQSKWTPGQGARQA